MSDMADVKSYLAEVRPNLAILKRRRLSLEELLVQVSGMTRRRIAIEVCPDLLETHTSGAWVAGPEEDLVLTIPTRSWSHHCLIVYHEIGHLLMQALGIENPNEAKVLEGVSTRFGGVIRACRGENDSPFEVAAEHIADELLRNSLPQGSLTYFAREFG